jgi:hypothetical protein
LAVVRAKVGLADFQRGLNQFQRFIQPTHALIHQRNVSHASQSLGIAWPVKDFLPFHSRHQKRQRVVQPTSTTIRRREIDGAPNRIGIVRSKFREI